MCGLSGIYYEVRPKEGLCKCPFSMRGRLCSHLAFLTVHCGLTVLNAPVVTEEDREELCFLARGADIPEGNFFLKKTQIAAEPRNLNEDNIPICD